MGIWEWGIYALQYVGHLWFNGRAYNREIIFAMTELQAPKLTSE